MTSTPETELATAPASTAHPEVLTAADRTGPVADPVAPATASAEPVAAETAGGRAQRLVEEGDVGADYLEELLDIVDLDGDIDIGVEDGRAALSIIGEDGAESSPDGGAGSPLRALAGRRGDVLEALQELTRLAVQARTGERSRLMLDVAGYRAQRRRELVALATTAVEEVRSGGQSVRLTAMNPFERKVVHDAVAAAGLASDSEGVEPQRRVVVHPA